LGIAQGFFRFLGKLHKKEVRAKGTPLWNRCDEMDFKKAKNSSFWKFSAFCL
jgi:hypothetical protein